MQGCATPAARLTLLSPQMEKWWASGQAVAVVTVAVAAFRLMSICSPCAAALCNMLNEAVGMSRNAAYRGPARGGGGRKFRVIYGDNLPPKGKQPVQGAYFNV